VRTVRVPPSTRCHTPIARYMRMHAYIYLHFCPLPVVSACAHSPHTLRRAHRRRGLPQTAPVYLSFESPTPVGRGSRVTSALPSVVSETVLPLCPAWHAVLWLRWWWWWWWWRGPCAPLSALAVGSLLRVPPPHGSGHAHLRETYVHAYREQLRLFLSDRPSTGRLVRSGSDGGVADCSSSQTASPAGPSHSW